MNEQRLPQKQNLVLTDEERKDLMQRWKKKKQDRIDSKHKTKKGYAIVELAIYLEHKFLICSSHRGSV